MYSIRSYQDYSFHCWFSNNSVLAFVVSVLSQDRVSLRSSHSILTFVPEALCCCSLQTFFLFFLGSCSFHAYPFNRSVVSLCSSSFILSSLSSLFNPSVVRICNSLFLFPTGVLSTLFLSVVFFSRDGLTFFKVLWSHSFVKEAT